MNREDRVKLLARSLNEVNRKAEQERADKLQVERIARDVQAHIAAASEKAKLAHIHASDDDLVCPSCGYKGPESDFEPDTDEESDGYSTDDEISETGDDDDVEELDTAGKRRVVAELLRNHKRRS
jgi:hypothetical protein